MNREEKIGLIKKLIFSDELKAARLLCKSWKIARSVFLKYVREYGKEEKAAKEGL